MRYTTQIFPQPQLHSWFRVTAVGQDVEGMDVTLTQVEPPDAEQLAAGVKAAIVLRLISGNTDQVYTPTEVSTMVSEVVDEQLARLTNP